MGRSKMKACPNSDCVGLGRIIYSLVTRCPLCKWDLKTTLPASEIATAQKTDRHFPPPRRFRQLADKTGVSSWGE